ncbi:hypothetical protein KQX54_019271 [Cotesia glomerata]|uniref:Uncharacterized protein n=1 Tax=Cotesia glomerata TaxID=32391 RepID=A0AAV7IFB9_COTGL|nr:hypothetical protein KQX54_019271 [Cotesia glomerata]
MRNSNTQVALQAAQGQNIQSPGETQGGPNTVLRVIIEHMIYPISLDILYQTALQADPLHRNRFYGKDVPQPNKMSLLLFHQPILILRLLIPP